MLLYLNDQHISEQQSRLNDVYKYAFQKTIWRKVVCNCFLTKIELTLLRYFFQMMVLITITKKKKKTLAVFVMHIFIHDNEHANVLYS